jgi:hypothetical protein
VFGRFLQYDFLFFAGITVTVLLASQTLMSLPAYAKIDSFVSNRLTYSAYAYQQFGFPIIGGTKVELAPAGLVLDSSYLRIIYDHGLVVLVFLLLLFTLLQREVFKERDYLLLMIFFLISVHSIFDAQLMSFQQNTFLFLLGTVIPGGVSFAHQTHFSNPVGLSR